MQSSLPGIISFLFSIRGRSTDICDKQEQLGPDGADCGRNRHYILTNPQLTTSRGAWSMSSKRIHWPLDTA